MTAAMQLPLGPTITDTGSFVDRGVRMMGSAMFDASRRYRWELTRYWGTEYQSFDASTWCTWIMLNPSDAREDKNDPTICAVIDFSRAMGFFGACVVNLFARISSNPLALSVLSPYEAIGEYNDDHIERAVQDTGRVVAAWGALKLFRERAHAVCDAVTEMTDLFALKLTADGSPSHPLARGKGFIPRDTKASIWISRGGRNV